MMKVSNLSPTYGLPDCPDPLEVLLDRQQTHEHLDSSVPGVTHYSVLVISITQWRGCTRPRGSWRPPPRTGALPPPRRGCEGPRHHVWAGVGLTIRTKAFDEISRKFTQYVEKALTDEKFC